MELSTSIGLGVVCFFLALILFVIVLKCWMKGKKCPSKCNIDGKTVLITSADTTDGIELARELSHRGGRIIMACNDVNLGQDIAIDIRGETNGEVIVEHVDMSSIKSIKEFCTKILETESKIHVLINNSVVQWVPKEKTAEGFELHWGINHISTFVMTRLLLPLLHRGAPDARIITVSSSWYLKSKGINWDDPNFHNEKYSAYKAFAQSKLANVLFSQELSRKLEGTGVNTYVVDPGAVRSGLGLHLIKGLGCAWACLVLGCWMPYLKSTENAIQTTVYCATDDHLKDQTGFFYKDCAIRLTNDLASDLEAAHRLWEMSERMAVISS